MLQHKDRVLLRVLELLEQQQRLLVVTQTPLYTITYERLELDMKRERREGPLTGSAITYKHCVVLPVVVVDLVLLQGSRQDLPGGVVQAHLEALQVVGTILPRRFLPESSEVVGAVLPDRLVSQTLAKTTGTSVVRGHGKDVGRVAA